MARAEKSHYKHMNRKRADLIRELYFTGKIKQAELARGFGLTQGSVSRIVSGAVWNA